MPFAPIAGMHTLGVPAPEALALERVPRDIHESGMRKSAARTPDKVRGGIGQSFGE